MPLFLTHQAQFLLRNILPQLFSTANGYFQSREKKRLASAEDHDIVDVIAAAMNSGNDVLDVERGERRVILMQMTILASVLSTLANLSPDLCADHL